MKIVLSPKAVVASVIGGIFLFFVLCHLIGLFSTAIIFGVIFYFCTLEMINKLVNHIFGPILKYYTKNWVSGIYKKAEEINKLERDNMTKKGKE